MKTGHQKGACCHRVDLDTMAVHKDQVHYESKSISLLRQKRNPLVDVKPTKGGNSAHITCNIPCQRRLQMLLQELRKGP